MAFSTAIYLALFIIAVVFVGVFMSQARQQRQAQEQAQSLLDRALAKFPGYTGKPAVLGNSLVLLIDQTKQSALVASATGQAKEIPFADFERLKFWKMGSPLPRHVSEERWDEGHGRYRMTTLPLPRRCLRTLRFPSDRSPSVSDALRPPYTAICLPPVPMRHSPRVSGQMGMNS